jgi:hypothetical protein
MEFIMGKLPSATLLSPTTLLKALRDILLLERSSAIAEAVNGLPPTGLIS